MLFKLILSASRTSGCVTVERWMRCEGGEANGGAGDLTTARGEACVSFFTKR
jgi:hypothetical protein